MAALSHCAFMTLQSPRVAQEGKLYACNPPSAVSPPGGPKQVLCPSLKPPRKVTGTVENRNRRSQECLGRRKEGEAWHLAAWRWQHSSRVLGISTEEQEQEQEQEQGSSPRCDSSGTPAVTRGSHPLTVLLMVHRANDAIKLFFHLSPTRVQLALNLSVF